MYHISDLKKYNRCKRLYFLDASCQEKPVFNSYVRLDEEITALGMKKLNVQEAFIGERNDLPERALAALETSDWLVKARFEYGGLRIKVPFLHRVSDGWDLYFLYAGLYPRMLDMQFYCDTVWVLEKLNIPLNEIYIIHLNADYVRTDSLDTDALFIISEYFYNANNHPSVKVKDAIEENMKELTPLIEEMQQADAMKQIPESVRLKACAGRVKCRYYDECFSEEQVDPHSILHLTGGQYRYAMQREGRKYLRDADVNRVEGTRIQYAQVMADKNGGLFFDQCALRGFLSDITYPLAFLDFEWERYAIPPYKGMKPYDVLPFEYSLHIMREDGSLEHKVFLSVHDDRKEMIERLLQDIPATGSVIAFNAEGAEKIRIQEMAEQFPEYAHALLSINLRMKDLQIPFENGYVYDLRMCGMWNLKRIMSLFDDESYKNLEIHQGMDAVFQWRHLDREEEDTDAKQIMDDLKAYCGMDSYAMTVVYQWLKMLAFKDIKPIDYLLQ